MSNSFQELVAEYSDQLESFTRALNGTIETYARDVASLTEAQRKIETHLTRSIKEWVTDFGGSYAIRLKQTARQRLQNQAGDQHDDLFELENGLDQVVEQRLLQLGQPNGNAPSLEVPSPYLKPGATLGAAAMVSFVLLTRGSLLFLVAGMVVGGGGFFASRKILQNELLRTRDDLRIQAQSIVAELKQGVASYFRTAAQAIEETTDQYIQEHIGDTSREQE